MSEELHSEIDLATCKSYCETEFRVFGDNPTILMIGLRSSVLAELHNRRGVDCSAFISACNSYSAMLSDAANAARQAAFAAELLHLGFDFVDGVGQHPLNDWPGEPSFLVFGLSQEEAKAIGRRLEQNAIVWSGADAVPFLILLR